MIFIPFVDIRHNNFNTAVYDHNKNLDTKNQALGLAMSVRKKF